MALGKLQHADHLINKQKKKNKEKDVKTQREWVCIGLK